MRNIFPRDKIQIHLKSHIKSWFTQKPFSRNITWFCVNFLNKDFCTKIATNIYILFHIWYKEFHSSYNIIQNEGWELIVTGQHYYYSQCSRLIIISSSSTSQPFSPKENSNIQVQSLFLTIISNSFSHGSHSWILIIPH